ncbi:ribonuclease H2 subunit C isoform X1 [Carcharodon carcharias]|uniref:ribonuclease H2 subunit C isoform X1 n=1 Tax=Carcharodon carcharias TaxID=13397 RepID=UPI001B7E63F2|nr:ribonuclease H2 subunit C isoform X1 [Carcharodon carcharias]XP_041037980.1 ribonuclease H2 subunit C isoform X1 [Carcharodon carcharias]
MANAGSPVIELDLSSMKDPPRDGLHLLPAEIESDGDANVHQYFTAAIQEREGEMQVSFRGRALRGRDLPVPLGYVGLVLKEDHEPCLEEEDRRLRVKSAFSSMTYWNLETPPTADDSVVMVMSWTQLAEAIHGPVEDQ